METSEKYKISGKVKHALNLAKDLHSHLGPFLVIGMRMGWAALRELKVTRGDPSMKVDVHLPYVTPTSCIIDGIQITTACTVGNKRLRIKNSKSIYMKFKIKSVCLTVKLRTQALKFIQKSLAKNLSVGEMEKLAYRVVAMPEKQLIDITNFQK